MRGYLPGLILPVFLLGAWGAQPKPAPASQRRPNILFILPDQLRAQSLGYLGNRDVRTPNIDRLAAEGVTFAQTFANTPVCCPARAVSGACWGRVLDATGTGGTAEAGRWRREKDATVQALDALITRRRQLLDMLTAERHRLEHAVGPIRRGLTDHIRWLERRVADVDRDLDQTIATSPAWRAKDDLLQSVPGIGPVVSRTLLADEPELRSLSEKLSS